MYLWYCAAPQRKEAAKELWGLVERTQSQPKGASPSWVWYNLSIKIVKDQVVSE